MLLNEPTIQRSYFKLQKDIRKVDRTGSKGAIVKDNAEGVKIVNKLIVTFFHDFFSHRFCFVSRNSQLVPL